jgi:hypothetical protein
MKDKKKQMLSNRPGVKGFPQAVSNDNDFSVSLYLLTSDYR